MHCQGTACTRSFNMALASAENFNDFSFVNCEPSYFTGATTVSIMALNLMDLIGTLSLNDTRIRNECHYAESVFMLSVIMLSVIMLSIVMLSVVVPFCWFNIWVTKSPNSYSGPSTLVVLSHRCVLLFKTPICN